LRFESTNKQWRKEDLDKTMRGWNGRIKDALDNVITPRIRKETKARNYASAVELITEGNEFCTFFGIRKRWSLPTSMEGLAGELQEAKKRADAKEQRQIAKNARDRIARGHTLRQEYARALPMWLDGKIPKLPPNPDVELTAYLRIVPKIAYETFTAETEREVETSQGARFPLSHAVRALRLIRGLQQSAERRLLNESRESAFADPLFVHNGHSIKLGYYQIDRIESDGTIKAGCHVVSGAEFERFALVVEEYMRSLPSAELITLATDSTEGDSNQ
jgi:hypothetical protein